MTISSLTNCCAVSTAAPSRTQSISNVQAEVEKLQRQYESWANCSSSKTSQGKAKIDEISVKLEAAKQELKKAEESKSVEKTLSVPINGPVGHKPSLRLDGLGTYVDEMA